MNLFYYLAQLTGNKKAQFKHLLLADKLSTAKPVALPYKTIQYIACQKIKENNTQTLKYMLEHNMLDANSIVYHAREIISIKCIKFIIHYIGDNRETDNILKFLEEIDEPQLVSSWAKGANALHEEIRGIKYQKREDWYRLYENCRLDRIDAVVEYHLSGGDVNCRNHEMLFKCMKNGWTLAAEYLCEFCEEDGLFTHFPQYRHLRDFKLNKRALYESLNENLENKNDTKKIKI